MPKVSGTYPSLSRGVNQQPFEARLDGQHGEQVNMWSDPVHGLSRRRGTTLQHCYTDNVYGPSYFQLSDFQKQELRDFYASYRTVPYVTDGLELQVHYPTKPQPTWMQSIFEGGQGGIRVTRKIQGAASLQPGADVEEVGYGIYGDPEFNATRAAVFKGIAAACQVGRYMLFMPNDTPFAVPPETNYWASEANSHWAVEIKQGIPNRTYKVGYTVDGVEYAFDYTTPSSAYNGTLTTSDIPYDDPEYQKKVNDRVNAYNSAVTQWITTAAQQTRPAYIVDQLMGYGLAAPLIAVGSTVWGGSGYITSNVIVVKNSNGRTRSPEADDGGDGSNVRVSGSTVTSTDNLTNAHYYGKVVRVKPERGDQSFYMRAVNAGDAQSTAVWGKVRWEECASTTQAAITNPMLVMAVKNVPQPATRVGVSLASPAGMAYLASNRLLNDPTVLSLPSFNGRAVGDEDSSPTPRFFGKQVSWMGMFQDRLCVAAGNTIDMSELGNYFNFFRTQTLTVPDSDPVSIFALGSETDTIRHSVIFDRSLLLFGDNQQYSIDGRNPVTPSTSTIIQSSAIEDATDCPPVAGGSLVFFGKRREGSAEIFQMEVGDVADTSNFTGLGLQLSDYLPGRPAQLLYVASPSTLFVRVSEAPHSVFVFRFIDQNRQRILDSWSRFDYHPAFGLIYGMFYHEDALYFRVAREAWVDGDGTVWTGGRGDFGFDVLERQSLLPQVPGLPYLDSMRRADSPYAGTAYGADFWGKNYPFLATVFTRDKIANYSLTDPPPPKFQYWLHGVQPNIKSLAEWNTAFEDIPTRDMNYCVLGIPFDSYVELTSPVRRDQNGQPIMQGRLTVNRLDVYYKDAGGFEATVTSRYGITQQYNNFDWSVTDTAYGKVTALRFNGRVLGQEANMVGVIPVTTGSTPVFVGRESKDYVCTIRSRSWMPLSITRVTWTGQWFMNHRFV